MLGGRTLMRIVSAGVALAIIISGPVARAQAYEPYGYGGPAANVLQGHIMGGYSAPSGATSNYLQGGWIIDGGVTFWPHAGPLGLRADVSYSAHNATSRFLDFGQQLTGQQVDTGWGDFASVAGGLVFRPRQYGPAHFYGLAQIGATRVQLRLEQIFGAPGFYCDPFFDYCASTFDYGAATVFDATTTKLSWNLGLGVEFASYWGSNWFIETQYRRVETQQPFEYWPFTVGIRF
jgi:opacity protein-like surface antigen